MEKYIENSKKSKSICALPWLHLATHPIGTITPCCITDMKDSASTAATDHDEAQHLFLSKDSLDSIANSKKFKKLRKEMMNGEFSSLCQKCYKYEAAGVESKREVSNREYGKYLEECIKNTDSTGYIKDVNYRYIELRLGSVCNLKCVTCNPFSSNRWNQDIHVFKGTEFEKEYFKNEIKTEWYRDYGFYDNLLDKCKDLQEIWINGGEPTLIKEHGYFLQKLIDNNQAKDIKISYSLNSTKFPDSFLEIWKKFKKVKIQISIDDIEERNHYVRYPSDWNTIMTAFTKIAKYKDVFELEICQTVSALNVYNLSKFKNFFKEYGLLFSHNYVHYPSHLQVSIIPEELKQQVLENNSDLTEMEIDRLKSELYKSAGPKELDKFKSYINLLDRARNLKIQNYLPEWEPYFK